MAREENDGNIELIDQTLRQAAPDALKAAYGTAARHAIAALKDLNAFLAGTLSKKTSDWRLGKEKYARKFALRAGAATRRRSSCWPTPRADLQATRMEMAKLAAPKTVKQALDEIARSTRRPTPTWPRRKKTLEQATAFVREKELRDAAAAVEPRR